jgi:hypothetical protein
VKLAVLLALGACAGAPRDPSRVTRDDAIVVVRSNVPDAQVFIDGRFIAALDAMRAGVAVSPGTHRFELRRDDFFSTYVELTLVRAERRRVDLDLAPVLP